MTSFMNALSQIRSVGKVARLTQEISGCNTTASPDNFLQQTQNLLFAWFFNRFLQTTIGPIIHYTGRPIIIIMRPKAS